MGGTVRVRVRVRVQARGRVVFNDALRDGSAAVWGSGPGGRGRHTTGLPALVGASPSPSP